MPAISILDLDNAKVDVDHIADIATSSLPTATDRLGHTKQTISGLLADVASDAIDAVASLTVINARGAWAPATAYDVRDVVSVSGTWYICLVAHISSGAFATDSASKWRIYQGVISGELAAATGAAGIGFRQPDAGAVATTVEKKLQAFKGLKEDFGAIADGIADDRPALISALASGHPIYLSAGTYYLSDYVRPVNGSKVMLIGEHRDLVTIKCLAGRIPIYCDATAGADNRISGAFISGITFDGGHVRDPSQFGYGSDPGASMRQALTLRGSKGAADRGDVVITRCRFKNINGLPVWVADFDGSVEFSFNHLSKTKDLGFLYNNNLKIINNTIEFSADNGMSVSRSNQNVLVTGNHIRDSAGAGIFVGGVDILGSGANLTVSGASYVAGATLSLAASGATFTSEDVGLNFTLRSGASEAILRCIAAASGTAATVVAVTAVPVALQATATSDWSRGPVSGAQSGTISDNVIEGGGGYGVYLSGGCKDLNVGDNTIRRIGMLCDSETVTTGSIVKANNVLAVASATGFAVNDWIVVAPDYTNENTFIAQITGIAGLNFTLSAVAPASLIGEQVFKARRQVGSYGILVIGQWESAVNLEFAENLQIHDNIIIDAVTGGMRLGSTSGAVRDCDVHHNQILLRQTAHLDSAVFGILLGDQGTTAMRTTRMDVCENSISLDGVIGVGIYYKPIDSSVNSYIRIAKNKTRLCASSVKVIEQTGMTDITRAYQPTTVFGSLPTLDLLTSNVLGLSSWATAAVVAGVLTVNQSLNAYTPVGPVTVTDIDFSSINHDTPLIVIRNASATDSITFTFNVTKIRTQGGVDAVIPPYGSISFIPVSSTVVQQVA